MHLNFFLRILRILERLNFTQHNAINIWHYSNHPETNSNSHHIIIEKLILELPLMLELRKLTKT